MTCRAPAGIPVGMWIIVRLLTAAIVGLAKFYWRRSRVQQDRFTGDVAWVLTQGKNKGRVFSTSFGLSFTHPVFFRLSPERGWDRFFKRIGFTHEIQTDDSAFDAAVYVACDHPALAPVLQEDADARVAILDLFAAGAQCIYADGANLWVRRSGDTPPDEAELGKLAKVRAALQTVPAADFQTLRDPYFWRALAIGALVWSLALYGVPAIFENITRAEPLYFDWWPVIRLGAAAALGTAVVLVGLTWMLLRGSSRSHRVLVENLLVLILGLPFSSVELVSDANIGLDRSTPVVVQAGVGGTYTTITHGRHGSHTHYHVRLLPTRDPVNPLPATIEVSSGVYRRAHKGGQLAVTMHAGALGVPWVQEVTPRP